MSILFSFLFIVAVIFPYYSSLEFGSAQSLQHDHRQLVKNASESLRRSLGSVCGSGNLIDDCWVCDLDWHKHRRRLAKCATGFGKNAIGGKYGKTYVVTSNSDDNVTDPVEGTLRFGVIQVEPLWIKFRESMTIVLKEELIMNSYKTIDGRGVEVVLTGISGITVQNVRHVIIHDLTIHDMKPTLGKNDVRSTPSHVGQRGKSDGDGISIFGSSDVWVDHCTLYHCKDGLIDVVEASTDVTISNNLFYDHDEVMLFGHNDHYTQDVDMRVTVAYNVFGKGLNQRMPRCRFGRFEMINNHYKCGWGIYAIAGTSKPTIVSRGNVFYAPDDPCKKNVTFHVDEDYETWKNYDWSSGGDLLLNGAIFTSTGSSDLGDLSMTVKPHDDVEGMTANAGAFVITSTGRSGRTC